MPTEKKMLRCGGARLGQGLRRNFLGDGLNRRFNRLGSIEVRVAPRAQGDLVLLRFPFSNDHHVRNFVRFRPAYFGPEFGRLCVHAGPYAFLLKQFQAVLGKGNQVIIHWKNSYLFGSQPGGEISSKVFN